MQAAVSLQSEVERFVSAPVRRMLIDGKWVEAASGKTFETPNPATGEVLARVAAAGPEDVDRAVRAARPRRSGLGRGERRLGAGLPDGVVNIVPGFGETAGRAIVRHPMVDKIAFTGSTEVGKEIHRETSATLKRVSLELGGKSPNIVFSDADTEAAVQGALLGVFLCAGQVCCAGTRLFVEQKMHDEIAQKLAKSAAGMKQGNPFDADTRIGPLVSQEQLERVTGYLEIGKKEGAKPLIGGERNMAKGLEKGYYVKPTVLTGLRDDLKIAREEIFGPVVSVIPFKDEHDAVLQGNDTAYGLAAGVWTRDVSKAHRVARALRAGTVWVNCYNVFDPAAPFGGYKESGYGRELGRYALDLYTQVKSVWLKI